MAAEFIGYHVLVTLRAPPNATIQGEVANVIGQCLMLRNAVPSWSGQRLPAYQIDASNIADLSLGPPAAASSQNIRAVQENERRSAPPQPPPQPQPLVDPAIVSFAKPPSHAVASQGAQPTARGHAQAQQVGPRDQPELSSTLSEPFNHLQVNVEAQGARNNTPQEIPSHAYEPEAGDGTAPAQSATYFSTKPGRRGAQNKANKKSARQAAHGSFNEHDGATNTNPATKGWRQTAFVEPAKSPRAHREKGRQKKKKNRGSISEEPNGWATEEATDIQELGDFDFQSNLSKFDKRRVFEEIRNDDTTADEARLVSFNRKMPKPGTNGGKNLHWTENVLDSPQESEKGDSDEQALSDAKLSSETYSGRERSRAAARTQPVRKGSGVLSHSLVPPQLTTVGGRGPLSAHSRTSSPRPSKTSISASPITAAPLSGGSLRLTTTNRSCPTVSPLQTLEVEQITIAELGLTEDMITENAGRGIAEAAVGLLTNEAAAPTMLILTGNHRTGARAISAARHLRNRGHRVTVCMLGIEHETELLESCRKQLDVFKKIGGRVMRWEDLAARLSTSDFEPDLVIDALFGIHISFDDLRTDDQATAFEMIGWANRSTLDILSVDVPSGLSASSGEVTVVEGARLCVNSESVVCLGAPKTGIINALLATEELSWKLSVADIGIPQIVWRKYGTRRRHGIDFGNRWVVPLRFQPSSA